MILEFAGEAYETFQDALHKMEGYGVTITPLEGDAFDAELIGPVPDAEWGDTVKVRRADADWEQMGPVEEVRAKRIYVY